MIALLMKKFDVHYKKWSVCSEHGRHHQRALNGNRLEFHSEVIWDETTGELTAVKESAKLCQWADGDDEGIGEVV